MPDTSLSQIATAVKSPNPTTIIRLGLKGGARGAEYIRTHKGKWHPYMMAFGPLGGLLIPEEQLQPVEREVPGKARLLPTSPQEGPPLPRMLNIKWPWSK